jgi:hypothetical protein
LAPDRYGSLYAVVVDTVVAMIAAAVVPARLPKLRLPPGARRLVTARPLAGEFPNALFVFVGDEAWTYWRDADERDDPALCVPPGEKPEAFDWRPCRGRDVLLVQAGTEDDATVTEAAVRIAQVGPRSLIVAAECVHPLHCDGYLFGNALPMVRLA